MNWLKVSILFQYNFIKSKNAIPQKRDRLVTECVTFPFVGLANVVWCVVSWSGGVWWSLVVGSHRFFWSILWEIVSGNFVRTILNSNDNDYHLQESILKMILNSNDNENHFHLKAFSDFEESENRPFQYILCNNFLKYSCNI